MHCTCQLTSLIEVWPLVWCLMKAHTSHKLHVCFLQGTLHCAVSHVMSVLAIHVCCIVLETIWTTMTCHASFFVVQLNGFMSFTSYFDVMYIINITGTKCVTPVKVSNFSGHYLRNRSTLDQVFWVISAYFNIKNALPKFGTFHLGHSIYTKHDMYDTLTMCYDKKPSCENCGTQL
jgi:hypothetical protein